MDEAEFYKKLGKRIKTLRENAHLTQEKLAEKSGISLDYLGKIEVNIKMQYNNLIYIIIKIKKISIYLNNYILSKIIFLNFNYLQGFAPHPTSFGAPKKQKGYILA